MITDHGTGFRELSAVPGLRQAQPTGTSTVSERIRRHGFIISILFKTKRPEKIRLISVSCIELGY